MSASHLSPLTVFLAALEVGIVVTVLQTRARKHREVQPFAQDHFGPKWGPRIRSPLRCLGILATLQILLLQIKSK